MLKWLKRIMGYLFAPLGEYAPAGMFTGSHIAALLASAAGIFVALRKGADADRETLRRRTRRFAVAVAALELIKIVYNLANGYTWPDAWVPLSFCSLFLYALWMAGFCGGWLRRLGKAFLIFGTVTGGAAFLIFPTTSLMNYPAWHYLCLYSVLYHSSMVCFGVWYLRQEPKRPGKEEYRRFTAFFGLFAAVSIVLNGLLPANFMLLREPYNIPFDSLRRLYQSVPAAYTFLALAAYLAAPALVTGLLYPLLKRAKGRRLRKAAAAG